MKAKSSENVIDSRRYWTILGFILLCSLCIKLIRLDFPPDFYFDEVYHGFTATYYLNDNPESYSMYHKNPPGKAVEWTHPPLAKLLMTASMMVFGENSFGWRFSSALFGTLAALFAALLAWQLFGSARVSYLTAFFLSIEGLIFSQSRIAMNDAHLICFVLMSLYFYVRWKKNPTFHNILYSGTGLGLALSCKWSALFVFFIIGMDQIAELWREFRLPTLKELRDFAFFYLLLPASIYLLSYFHFFWLGNTWEDLKRLHSSMWWYHTNLTATHPYMSKPYHWLLNLKPVWMHVTYFPDNTVANIFNIGNTVILYLGLAVILNHLSDGLKDYKWKRLIGWPGAGWAFLIFLMLVEPKAGILVVAFTTLVIAIYTHTRLQWPIWFALVAYFMVWLPWTFSPRIMLFYHYAPAVPMLSILLSKKLDDAWLANQKNIVYGVVGAAFIWFALLYPVNAAVPLPREFMEAIYSTVESVRSTAGSILGFFPDLRGFSQ